MLYTLENLDEIDTFFLGPERTGWHGNALVCLWVSQGTGVHLSRLRTYTGMAAQFGSQSESYRTQWQALQCMKMAWRWQTHGHLGAKDHRKRNTFEYPKPWAEARVRLRESKELIFRGELDEGRSIHKGPNGTLALKRLEKTLSLHPGMISRLKGPLINKFLRLSAKTGKGGSSFKCLIFKKRSQCIQRSKDHDSYKGTKLISRSSPCRNTHMKLNT